MSVRYFGLIHFGFYWHKSHRFECLLFVCKWLICAKWVHLNISVCIFVFFSTIVYYFLKELIFFSSPHIVYQSDSGNVHTHTYIYKQHPYERFLLCQWIIYFTFLFLDICLIHYVHSLFDLFFAFFFFVFFYLSVCLTLCDIFLFRLVFCFFVLCLSLQMKAVSFEIAIKSNKSWLTLGKHLTIHIQLFSIHWRSWCEKMFNEFE